MPFLYSTLTLYNHNLIVYWEAYRSIEKEALFYRLQQMEEERRLFLKEQKSEREDICDRLRELDRKLTGGFTFYAPETETEDEVNTDVPVHEAPIEEPPAFEDTNNVSEEERSEVVESSLPLPSSESPEAAKRPRVSNVQAVREILKENESSMRIGEIKKELNDKYGLNPANLSQMLYKMKNDEEEIVSPGRATYMYINPSEANKEETEEEL